MADSLGEKLRQAREERDISISEVAEQTRISALYLEAIEKNDYRTLPGGIFNKGFVKSFAKYVGVDEHEALQDYAKIAASEEAASPDSESGRYRPEVLTDERRGSMLPTIIFAVLILGLMAWGIHALVKYVQSTESGASGKDSIEAANVKTDETPAANANTGNSNTPADIPATDSIKVKISTSADELAIQAKSDGKLETVLLTGDNKERIIEADESVSLSYYKGLAESVSLEINGKKIATPLPPDNYRKNGLEYEINMSNIKTILKDGKIDLEATPAPVDGNTATTANPAPNTNSGNGQ